VRWDELFDDLEGQLEHELNAESGDLRAEEERLRLGRLSVRSRLVSLAGGSGTDFGAVLRLVLQSGDTILIRARTFGRDWVAADLLGGAGGQCVLPLDAIAAVILATGDIEHSLDSESESASRVVERIGLPFVLRDLCRRRKSVELNTTTGILTGTIDRVGRDHIDVAVHAPGTLRRSREIEQYRIVPLQQIRLIKLA
jgi:hypothetical protein